MPMACPLFGRESFHIVAVSLLCSHITLTSRENTILAPPFSMRLARKCPDRPVLMRRTGFGEGVVSD